MPERRIQAVAEATGVPAGTLRAWERRYGLPAPERSENGYRVYSAADIAQVQAMQQLIEQGLSASRAAEQVRRGVGAPVAAPVVDLWPTLVERVLAAIQAFDPDALDIELRKALLFGPAAEVYDRVLVPVMRALGDGWRDGTFGVAEEHLATEKLRGVFLDLHRLSQPARPLGLAVLACVSGEDHVLPLYGIAMRLNARRLRTIVLGARTPPAAIAKAVDRLAPDLVGLSVTVGLDPDAVEAYGRACSGTPWILGGAGAAALADAVRAAGGVLAHDTDLDTVLDGVI